MDVSFLDIATPRLMLYFLWQFLALYDAFVHKVHKVGEVVYFDLAVMGFLFAFKFLLPLLYLLSYLSPLTFK
jgi:hypothetical protein